MDNFRKNPNYKNINHSSVLKIQEQEKVNDKPNNDGSIYNKIKKLLNLQLDPQTV